MRILLAVFTFGLLGVYYYFTKDFFPLTSFAVIYGLYEVISRIKKLEILKIPLLFGLIYISLTTGFNYLKYPVNEFVYLISAGFALSIPVLKHRYGFIAGIAGIVILTVSFFLMPDVFPFNELKIPLTLSTAVIAITSILPVLHEKLEFLMDHRPFLVFLTVLTSVYYTQLRNTLQPGFRNLGDWILIAVTLTYFLGKFRFEIEETEPEKELISDFDTIAEMAERSYIENGDPVPLLSFLSYTLSRSGKSIKDLEKLFRIFIEREKLPKYSFGFEKDLILRRRKSKRIERMNLVKRMFKEVDENERR